MIQVYIYIIIEAKSVVKVSVVNSNQKCNANQSRVTQNKRRRQSKIQRQFTIQSLSNDQR